ncbi:Subtilisin-like protease 2 [Fulvia fulva]|uniref:Subtilisin-like protease 2 n=1 Tax=Passalora fulva TaxID=5499 RepID=A0A9Q8PKQ7_PASFU|nr:Subtilisin-like protease 2 [Fulvia fulva]KAK4610342.1 Subtilisin-like protease 2 [Fulvia fulva]KAK4611282.1 Subtilisin-like protease 2 [Fulvia fulva]UJO24197.1 Subtilisin-like protease 2 [Fulvia fulva]WPV22236.1 Subtilisin-like protease 2 [Fulvia fulva]WPV37126.1 Subtilisin-like protease 2 [Fulvia fulva]
MPSFINTLLAASAVLPAALAKPTIIRTQSAETISGKYIARVEDNEFLEAVLSTVLDVAGVESTYNYTIGGVKGFTFDGDDGVLDILETLGAIKHVEPDSKVYATVPYGYLNKKIAPLANTTQQVQNSSTWGLGRISHRESGSNSYSYDDSAGEGSFIYVIDTGVYTEHNEFEGRASMGANFIDGEEDSDGQGHGTHCSGTAAGKTYGVAKKASIIGVKVLGSDGSGTNSGVLRGVEWAVNNAKESGHIDRTVLSMSLGGTFSQTTNDAIEQAVAEGAFISVAAGNDGEDASNSSPASAPGACTVGATNEADSRSDFSNFGKILDIFAPGEEILSSWIGGKTATRTISGTSMACPHIAGLAAYLIGLEGPRSPAELCSRIQELATTDVIQGVGDGSPNLLAYNGIAA